MSLYENGYFIFCFLFSESSGIVLHKDSKWMAAWENFKDNNQYVQSKPIYSIVGMMAKNAPILSFLIF